MPTVTSGKVLVNGASGFLGAWIVKSLVDHGFEVVVTARKQDQLSFITSRFPSYAGRVSGLLVPDMTAPGAYDEAVKDVDAIIHAASPASYEFTEPSDLIDPAVGGVTNVLDAAKKFGTRVKRVVIIGAVHSLAFLEGTEIEYDETYWNDAAVELVKEKGKEADGRSVYTASKVLAERAAWAFMEGEKRSFDLTVILPTMVIGPYIHNAMTPKGVGSSPGIFLAMLPHHSDTSGNNAASFVDVRDAAEQHVLSLSTASAGGQRIVAFSDVLAFQDLYDILADENIKELPATGKDAYGAGKNKALLPRVSNKKSLETFPRFEYRTLGVTVKEMTEDFVRDGFLHRTSAVQA